jgi:uncharacterized protein (TIGR02058 family)|tara:strand:- start:338 stop:679 length:342 start_codon:yes stop_codon:yes gene_type:complete
MARTRLIVELGMGIDLHGQDYTKAARRAVEDAIHRSSLLYLADAGKEGNRPKMYVDVSIASPKPEAVDGETVLQAIPFGEKSVNIVVGGMDLEQTSRDHIIITNAAVLVTLEV